MYNLGKVIHVPSLHVLISSGAKDMYLSFESLVVINALGLHASLMDFHNDTFFNDFIFSAYKAHIHSCSGKGTGLWLVVRPFMCLFCIGHYVFISVLCFRLHSIQPSTFSLFMCECGHKLNASNTHLDRCPF